MYHKPVLLEQAVELLKIQPAGIYVDATFGSGGHSRSILEQLPNGQLVAFDQDPDAQKNIIADARFELVPQNFRYLKNFLRIQGIQSIDGILADLGISSWQIDQPKRGFSIRFEGDLDMRMDQHQDLTARAVINEYPEEALADIFYKYGEIVQSRKLAGYITKNRKVREYRTTADLVNSISSFAPRGKENQFLAKVFQALRIEVNEELEALKEMLAQANEMLNPGGRMVIIAYHSLEDKLVKNYFNSGNFDGALEKDFFGNVITPFRVVTRKAIKPEEAEIKDNPRSRSARLRAVEKI